MFFVLMIPALKRRVRLCPPKGRGNERLVLHKRSDPTHPQKRGTNHETNRMPDVSAYLKHLILHQTLFLLKGLYMGMVNKPTH
jgi:hypothetical protein